MSAFSLAAAALPSRASPGTGHGTSVRCVHAYAPAATPERAGSRVRAQLGSASSGSVSFVGQPPPIRLVPSQPNTALLVRCSAEGEAAASEDPNPFFPKRWKCVEGCGACCDLTPEDRPGLDKYLTPDEYKTYMDMVGEDGWCKHYDSKHRTCTIYDTRPEFCRVTLEGMRDRYGVPEQKADKFACNCCKCQIGAVYGFDSEEMVRFKEAIGTQPAASGSKQKKKRR